MTVTEAMRATLYQSPNGRMIVLAVPYRDRRAELRMSEHEARVFVARIVEVCGGTAPERAVPGGDPHFSVSRRGDMVVVATDNQPGLGDPEVVHLHLGLSGARNLAMSVLDMLPDARTGCAGVRRRTRPTDGIAEKPEPRRDGTTG